MGAFKTLQKTVILAIQTRFYDGAEGARAPPSSPVDSLLLCCMLASATRLLTLEHLQHIR